VPGARAAQRETAMSRPLLRYSLLQVPDIALLALVLCALREWWDLGAVTAWVLLALWIAKDAAMYPLVRRSLADSSDRLGAAALIGAEGVVEQALAPRGWVRVRGELWQAESLSPGALPAATRVRIRAVRGLELQVEPSAAPAPDSGDSRSRGSVT
jgi:membrane-bound serine protease (ClpP class)